VKGVVDHVQRSEPDYKGPALWLLNLFATKDDWEWADTIFRLVKSGFLLSGSVGFWSSKVIDIRDEEERGELGLGRWGLIFEENHLLEYSPTTIPANPGAHAIARDLQRIGKARDSLPDATMLLQPQDVTMLREIVRRDIGNDRQAWIDAETAILHVARSVWPDEEFTFHAELDVPVTLENPAHARTRTHALAHARAGEPEEGAATSPETGEQEVSARLGSLEKAVGNVARTLDEFKTEATQVFTDLRELLETLPSKGSGEEAVESATERVDEVVSSLEEALKNLKSIRPSP